MTKTFVKEPLASPGSANYLLYHALQEEDHWEFQLCVLKGLKGTLKLSWLVTNVDGMEGCTLKYLL